MSNVPPPPPLDAPQDGYFSPEPMPRQGMSTGAKLLIILSIIFGCLAVLCCAGLILITRYAGTYLEDAFTDDPVKVERHRAELLDIEIPEAFEPQGSMNMSIPLTDQSFMSMVIYADDQGGSIVLMSMGDTFADMSDVDMEQEMKDAMREQGMGPTDENIDWEVQQKKFTIEGETVTFTYRIARGAEGEAERFEVVGTVPGKRGPVLIMISADAQSITEEDIDAVIESIR